MLCIASLLLYQVERTDTVGSGESAVQASFTCLCATASVTIWVLGHLSNRWMIIARVPLSSWLMVMTAVVPVLVISGVAVNLTVRLLERTLSPMISHVHYIMMGMGRALRCARRHAIGKRLSRD